VGVYLYEHVPHECVCVDARRPLYGVKGKGKGKGKGLVSNSKG